MKPKFEIGDRVIYKPCKMTGSVINMYRTTGMYAVVFDEDVTSHYIHENDLEFDNPKLTFLTRLQELLVTFNASIRDNEQHGLWIDLDYSEQMVWYWDDKPIYERRLAADNVFHYDKD